MGSSNYGRYHFAVTGALPPNDESAMPLPVCAWDTNTTCTCGPGGTGPNNDWPALAAQVLMVVGRHAQRGMLVLSYDDLGESARLFGVTLPEAWRREGAGMEDILAGAVEHRASNIALCDSFDTALAGGVTRAGGAAYTSLAVVGCA